MTRNGTIPGVSQTEDEREITFDIVAKSPTGRYFAIEVSFQVTTNSVIERKAGQAQSRYNKLHQLGHKIAYVIDGAGNLEREAALRTICEYSDCTAAFSPEELELLVKFLEQHGGDEDGTLE
ncbi:Type-2 restriction enzyme BanI [bacterium HR15]|nr:Type-2 restriction enzyme BanI [bacterium HR15]